MTRKIIVLVAVVCMAAWCLTACKTPDRKPLGGEYSRRPDRNRARRGVVTTRIEVLGAQDNFADAVVLDALKRTQGVVSVEKDEYEDIFVVKHRIGETPRERLTRKIKEKGREAGYSFDPIIR